MGLLNDAVQGVRRRVLPEGREAGPQVVKVHRPLAALVELVEERVELRALGGGQVAETGRSQFFTQRRRRRY